MVFLLPITTPCIFPPLLKTKDKGQILQLTWRPAGLSSLGLPCTPRLVKLNLQDWAAPAVKTHSKPLAEWNAGDLCQQRLWALLLLWAAQLCSPSLQQSQNQPGLLGHSALLLPPVQPWLYTPVCCHGPSCWLAEGEDCSLKWQLKIQMFCGLFHGFCYLASKSQLVCHTSFYFLFFFFLPTVTRAENTALIDSAAMGREGLSWNSGLKIKPTWDKYFMPFVSKWRL